MFCHRWKHAATTLAVVALLVAGPASAEIYRWVDASGQEHFATDLSRVPPAYREAAMARAKTSGSRINVVQTPAASPRPAQPPASARPKRQGSVEKPGGYSEAWWRSQYASHLKFVESAKEFIAYQNEVAGRKHSRDERKAVGFAGKNLAAAEKRLADFLEKARAAGVPPGWVR